MLLVYRLEVILLIEVAIHIHWLTTFQEEVDNSTLREALDLLPRG